MENLPRYSAQKTGSLNMKIIKVLQIMLRELNKILHVRAQVGTEGCFPPTTLTTDKGTQSFSWKSLGHCGLRGWRGRNRP